MQLYILENGLSNAVGHHFNNSIGLRQALQAFGLNPRFLINKAAEQSVIDAIDASACIEYSPYDRTSEDRLCGDMESFFLQGTVIADNMLTAIGKELTAEDVVLVPTATYSELLACALLLEALPMERRPQVACNFVRENFLVQGSLELSAKAALYRFAANKLAKLSSPGRRLLIANGTAMARALMQVVSAQVHVFPIPKVYPATLLHERRRSPPAKPIIGVFGDMNRYKGFGLLPGLVRANPGFRWLIQNARDGSAAHWGSQDKWMLGHPDVEMITSGLPPDVYYERFNSVDIVLTPYDRNLKQLQTSGIFAEAAASGKVVVAPSNAWVVEHLQAGNWAGVMFDKQDVESISAALRNAASKLNELCESAARLAPAWRRNQSVHAYANMLCRYLGIGETQGKG